MTGWWARQSLRARLMTIGLLGLAVAQAVGSIAQLFQHSSRESIVYRHRWQAHDLVFWDNRSLLHLAAGCPDSLRRHLHRTTIEGDVPVG